MKRIATLLSLSAAAFLLNGCISRTVTIEPEHRGAQPSRKGKYGSDPQSEVVEKKIIWIWQDEFRHPK